MDIFSLEHSLLIPIQLDSIPTQHLQTCLLDGRATCIPVCLIPGSDVLQLKLETEGILGHLDSRYSEILRVLQLQPMIELQAYVFQARTECKHGRVKKLRNPPKRTRAADVTLSVIVYGHMDLFEALGDFLLRCSEYLQSPLRCNRNVPYRNPQSLSRKDENPPMTYHLPSQLPPTQVEMLAQNADPSAVLETEDFLPETEAPAVVQTLLYR